MFGKNWAEGLVNSNNTERLSEQSYLDQGFIRLGSYNVFSRSKDKVKTGEVK